jgi:intein/homing endonuclease
LGLYPTLSTGGRAIVFSTPAGKNFFYQMWMGAETGEWEEGKVGQHCKGVGKNGFHGIKLPWFVHPERDEKWFEDQAKPMDARGIAQELLCVGPHSRIETVDGFKLACDINVGDLVLTHKGRFKPVVKVGCRAVNHDETIYRVSVPGNRDENLWMTGNHPLYGKMFVCGSNQSPYKQIKEKQIPSRFYPLDDIAEFQTDYKHRFVSVLHPANYLENIVTEPNHKLDLWSLPVARKKFIKQENKLTYWRQRTTPINREIDIDFHLGRFIGLAVAEGCIHKHYSKKQVLTEQLQLAFHTDELQTLGKFVTDFYDKMGVAYDLDVRSYSKCFTIETSNKYAIALYRHFVVALDATQKYLNPETSFKTNVEFLKGFLVGHFDGDGDHPTAARKNNGGKKLKVVSKSTRLLYQVKMLLAAVGHYGRIDHKTSYYELDGVDQLIAPTMLELLNTNKCSLEKPGSRTRLIDHEFLGNIQYERRLKDECPLVYNIEVEEDNSYIVNGLVVHNCGFEGSTLTFFSQADIDFVRNLSQTPIGFTGPNNKGNDLHIWKTAVEEHKYVIAADVARGDAEDYSTFHVFDTNASEVVAEYMGKIPPDRFGDWLIEIGKRYNNSLIVNEKNTVGIATAIKLRDANYENVYYDLDLREKMLGMTPEEKKDALPGFTVSPKNREKILENLEQVIRNHQLKIYSLRFVEQMETFIWNGKRGQAIKKRHDDLILAMAIGLQMFTPLAAQEGYLGMQAVNQSLAMAMLKGMSRGYKDVDKKVQGKPLPFGVRKETIKAELEMRKEFWWLYT